MKKHGARWMKWLTLVITIAVLWAVYAHVDRRLLVASFSHMHYGFFALALFCFIPQILVTSWRWRVMMAPIHPMSLWGSIRLIMAGKAMNAVAPSKLGELSKAYFLKKEGGLDTGQVVSAVVLEKAFDVGGLCTALLIGVIFAPENNPAVWIGGAIAVGSLCALALLVTLPIGALGRKLIQISPRLEKIEKLLDGWEVVLAAWKRRGGGLASILGLSVLLWALHVTQIYLFFPALRHPIPLAPVLAYVPLSIFVGLIPVTVAGMGTRDSALIFLFSSYADPAVMAGIGLLCSLRYWIDTLVGIPFFHQYVREQSDVEEVPA